MVDLYLIIFGLILGFICVRANENWYKYTQSHWQAGIFSWLIFINGFLLMLAVTKFFHVNIYG